MKSWFWTMAKLLRGDGTTSSYQMADCIPLYMISNSVDGKAFARWLDYGHRTSKHHGRDPPLHAACSIRDSALARTHSRRGNHVFQDRHRCAQTPADEGAGR